MTRERRVLDKQPGGQREVERRESQTEEPRTWLLAGEAAAIWGCGARPAHHSLWMAVAIGTGVRVGGLVDLLWRDVRIDGEHPEFVVRHDST